MTPARALADRRVAVVTSRLWPGFNDLWDAARPGVAALEIVGALSAGNSHDAAPGRVALRSIDCGRGLVWQHLVGLRRFLRSFRPDLVHVNRELWAVIAQELVGLDTAVVVHGAENLWHHGRPLEQALRRRLVDRAVSRVTGYASWNHAGADYVAGRRRALGLDPVPTLVLPAVVPPRAYRDVAWSAPLLDRLEVLLVGRAVPAKGFQDVIEAAAELDGVRVTLCGHGPMLGDLRTLADRRGVALTTPGQLQPHQLAELMARSHVLVQPSRTTEDWAEQFGRAVAEAMTVGLPSLVSDSGELPHLVGHDSEAVFPEGDVAALRDRLRRLHRGPALAELALRQRAHADAWRPDRARDALLAFWEEVLA